MSNPAAELATLLSSWRGSGNLPVEARGGDFPGNTSFWQGQSDAVQKVREVDAALRSLASAGADVSMYDDYVADWYRAVFSFNRPWNQNFTGPVIDDGPLAMLRALATTLTFGATAGALSEPQRQSIGECIDSAFDTLEHDNEGLSPAELTYMYTVLNSARSVIEGKTILGAADLQAILDQLVGALTGLAAQFFNVDDDERRSAGILAVVGRIVSVTRSVTYDAAALATIAGYTVAQAIAQ